MKKHLVFVLFAIAFCWGCASARMYPVKGPLSSQRVAPVYQAKLTANLISGTLSTTLNNGERFKVPVNRDVHAGPTPPSLAAEWDSAYGTGYYKFKVLDAQVRLRGLATGTKGTTLQVELYENEIRPGPALKDDDSSRIEMHGIAKDSNGNVYKVEFQ
jgi:hypothetical protein